MVKNKHEHWKFFILTLLWSWGLLSIPIIMDLSMGSIVTKVLFALAGIAPTTVAVILAYLKQDKEYWKDFWNRNINFKRISMKWYLIIFLLIPLTSITGVLIHYLFTNYIPEFDSLRKVLSNPIQLLQFAIFMLFFGPVAEEIGWRGFALDHLDRKYHWIITSMIIGLFWALWHLPMYFIEGTYQNNLINGPALMVLDYNIEKFSTSIIMYWIYKNNRRSILAAVLYHFCINFFGEVMDLSGNILYYRTAVQAIIAVMIIIFCNQRYSKYDIINQKKVTKVMIFILILLVGVTGCNRGQKEFRTIEEAEKEIGRKIEIPDMPGTYKVSKIDYYNNDELTPILRVYFEDDKQKEIIFMITSSMEFDKQQYEEDIDNSKIDELKWIKESENYILKWRKSNQESYKYLMTKDEKDKDMLIMTAEK